MIPKLLPENTSDQHYVDFFKALKQTGFSGDIEYSYSSRLAVATDNSVYQKLPQGVILPKNINDLQLMLKLANTKQFEDIKFVGITGTNGKTTTAYLTSQILTELGINNAYIGTIGYYVNSEFIRELPNTTPDILSLYNLILESIENNVKVIVMEVSSHSLSLGRINGIKLDVAGFTNLTEDHLDYHETMENYLSAKKLILDYIKDDGVMISNIDD